MRHPEIELAIANVTKSLHEESEQLSDHISSYLEDMSTDEGVRDLFQTDEDSAKIDRIIQGLIHDDKFKKLMSKVHDRETFLRSYE
jgi:hypothetical protein